MLVLAIASWKMVNDHSYANLIIYNINPEGIDRKLLLHHFANSMKGIAQLKRSGMNREHCDYIEKLFYFHLPPEIYTWMRAMTRHAWCRYTSAIAATVYQPDYVWRTGNNAGKSTVNIMQERIRALTDGT